jgi:hypothetical protein
MPGPVSGYPSFGLFGPGGRVSGQRRGVDVAQAVDDDGELARRPRDPAPAEALGCIETPLDAAIRERKA